MTSGNAWSKVMRNSDRAMARRLWEAIAEGDADRLAACLSPEIVWRSHGSHPLAGEYHGLEKVLGYLARIGETVDELRSDVVDIFVSERGAVIRYRAQAQRGPKRYDNEVLLVLSIADERVVEATVVPVDQQKSGEFWRFD